MVKNTSFTDILLRETALSSKPNPLNLTQPDPGLFYCRTGCCIHCQFLLSTSLFRIRVFFSVALIGCSLSVFTCSLIYCREQFRISTASTALMIRSAAKALKSSAVRGMRLGCCHSWKAYNKHAVKKGGSFWDQS